MKASDSPLTNVLHLLDKCSESEIFAVAENLRQRLPDQWARITGREPHALEVKWRVSADVILDAIARSPDLTLRGVRGIIAEAVFEKWVLPLLPDWKSVELTTGEAFDFLLRRRTGHPAHARVQVKLQRLEKLAPKTASASLRGQLKHPPSELFVVEVQKTRSGKSKGEDTRPYRFGDFDILAVNMHPSTQDWREFRYTVASWLLPRLESTKLIQIMQPVAATPDNYWSDSLSECLNWYKSGLRRRLYQ
jgi:hypothetical protein